MKKSEYYKFANEMSLQIFRMRGVRQHDQSVISSVDLKKENEDPSNFLLVFRKLINVIIV